MGHFGVADQIACKQCETVYRPRQSQFFWKVNFVRSLLRTDQHEKTH